MTSAAAWSVVVAAALSLSCSDDGRRRSPESGFEDIAAAQGIVHPTFSGSTAKVHVRESLGQGLCWIDYDRDGDADLFVPNGGTDIRSGSAGLEPWRLYRNDGGSFKELARQAGLEGDAWGVGCAVGDFDRDGYDDLFVTTAGAGNRLFHNAGDGNFENWTDRYGVGDEQLATGAAFGDLDGDDDLDLVVGRYLNEASAPDRETCRWKTLDVMCGPKGFEPLSDLVYLNQDGSRLEESSQALGIAARAGFSLGVVLLDLDGLGRPAIFIANDSTPNHLWVPRDEGGFSERGLAAGIALSESGASQAGMGVDAGDLDGDGWEDLVVTNFSDDVNNFLRRDGLGLYSEWSGRSGLAAASFSRLSWSVLLEDFDLDGDLDAFFANGHVYPQVDEQDPNTEYRQAPQLLVNDGHGRLATPQNQLGDDFSQAVAGRGAAVADFDLDGRPDVAMTRDQEAPRLFRNRIAAPDNHWLRVVLLGHRGNPNALGAKVAVTARGSRQVREIRAARGYLSSSEPAPIFGLGESAKADRLEITWPTGRRQEIAELPANQTWAIPEPSTSSLPARAQL